MAGRRFGRRTALGAAACLLLLALGAAPDGTSSAEDRRMGPPMTPSPEDFWAPGWMHRHMWGGRQGVPSEVRARMQRHWTYMHYGIPAEYRGALSPLEPTQDTLRRGGELYATHCASCHGKKGLGDGEAAKGVSPSPALLAYMVQRPMLVDEYLLWTLAEGGVAFKTDMPAYKGTLARDDIWRIIAFMRAGFPSVADGKSE